jgi:hypothetical protein
MCVTTGPAALPASRHPRRARTVGAQTYLHAVTSAHTGAVRVQPRLGYGRDARPPLDHRRPEDP